jgi:hypothetical protein
METLARANNEIKKLKEKMDKPLSLISKDKFAAAGLDKRFSLLSGALEDRHKLIWDIFRKANKYYDILKGALNRTNSTHEFITEKALELLGKSNQTLLKELKAACVQPDTNKDMYRLAFEGHFYGKVRGGKYGNFLQNCFNNQTLMLIDLIDDIDETALGNFQTYYNKAFDKGDVNLKTLGWAAHYLQDLTAPHHVGNMAIFFEVFTDNSASHYAFEKYANIYVYDNQTAFQKKAGDFLKQLKPLFKPGKPEKFAKEVYNRATKNIAGIEDMSGWDAVINNAIPLAIGATAVIFEGI